VTGILYGPFSVLINYFLILFVTGILYGPFSVLINYFLLKNRKNRCALYCGAFSQAVYLLLMFCLLLPKYLNSPDQIQILTFIFINLMVITLAKICVEIKRYNNVSLDLERETRGILFQSYMFLKRDLIIQYRNWTELLSHFIQVAFTGVFLGLIFYGRHYKGPLFNQTYNCSNSIILEPTCNLAVQPEDDPIVTIASLVSLSVAICAVSYSINIFGKELNVFKRETSTGSSTEAYFFGKTLAHLPCTLFAPVCFLLSVGGLITLNGDLGLHYLIITLTYATFCGVGYFVSLVTPPDLSHLTGIFYVLMGIFFSGTQPTLIQLKNNIILGIVSYLPSYVSFPRWSIELFYLIEYPFYTNSFSLPETLYDYYSKDIVLCWCSLCTYLIIFRVAVYLRLVSLEQQ